jgi:hypothetical protein
MTVCIYLDESGDLGWKFTAPYRNGGSSRYLTISAMIAPEHKSHLPGRIVRDLYDRWKWSTAKEKKWSDMSTRARIDFGNHLVKLCTQHPDISFHSIVVDKQQVKLALRNDPNLLYNYMIKLFLVGEMRKYDQVTLIPDPRTIKIESGNSLHDYLQINLWYIENVETKLLTKPQDSSKSLGLQFTDMLAGATQHHFEDGNSASWDVISSHVTLTKLYF